MTPATLFALFWGVWALSWTVAALWTAADVERQAARTVWLPYLLLVGSILGPLLLQAGGFHAARWWNVGTAGADALALASVPGFLFAWWARFHLGALWSVAITRKGEHRVVDTGPYAVVRHPIYSGILWAALVTDIAGATVPALLSFAALTGGFVLKAGAEERFLANQLERGAYEAYRRRVPMLVPAAWL